MKVKYNQGSSGEEKNVRAWLSLQDEHVVLEVSASLKDSMTHYRLLAKDGKTPALFPANLFVVTSIDVPSNWSIVLTEAHLNILPSRWSRPGFWEAYFDGDQQALMEFREELRTLSENA